MKIVCDACTAKYSIADEKVAGKVFKIRCKKCENIIVVRGNTAEAAAPVEAEAPARSTKVFDQDQDAPDGGMSAAEAGDWHVVIDQEQVGPMTSDEVRVRFANGELDTESYIWKEGFADWERIPDVAEFADLENAAAAAPPADDGGMFGTPVAAAEPVAASGGLFGGDASGGVDLFGGGASAGAGSDLFGGGDPSVGDHTGEIAMSKEAEAQLKGQRNENSVLFSLGNLAALASDAPKAAAPSPASSPGVSNTGGSEGSGLIDIRSMASVYLADKSVAPTPGVGVGSADDLPVFSTSAFESASPLLMPTQSSGGDKKMLYTLFGIIAALVVAAAVLIVIVLGGDDDKTVAANTETAGKVTGDENPETPATTDPNAPETGTDPTETEVPVETGNPSETTPATTDPKGETDKPSEEPKKAEVKAAASRPEKPLSRSEKRALAKKEKADRERAKREKANRTVTPAKEKPSSGGTCDEITCLVEPNKACCKKYAKKSNNSSSSSSNSNLPDKLTKSDVKSGIGRVKGRVSSCGDKHNGRGIVTVKIKISGSGKVTSAAASGGNSGLRSCVSSAVKRAKFAKTQKGGSVNYPFRF